MPLLQPLVYRKIAIHVGAWLSYGLLQVVAIDQFEHQYVAHLLATLAQLPAQLLFTYLTLYWLIPTYLLTGQLVRFGVLTGVALLLGGLLYWEGTFYLFLTPFAPERLVGESPTSLGSIVLCAFYLLCTSSILIGFFMTRFAFQQQQLNQQLVIAQQVVELKSLKDQINPHFLFNTLNNLYGLTSQNPDKAGEVVLRLSELMQYMLYEGNLATVPLQKEITYLENYLALERIRYGPDLHLSFQVNGPTERVMLAPLLLLPFVENAFKHGLSRQLGDAWLQIQLAVTAQELTFKVENSQPELPDTASKVGIGLPNVAKRLDLLYPGRHRLRQLSGTDSFLTTLTITLIPSDLTVPQGYEDAMPVSR
ncbi:sensor histidine kinase [Spirosoma jeollabukense]